MASTNSITAEKLARLIGTPRCPMLIDVRSDQAFAADPRLIPGSLRRPYGGFATGVLAAPSAIVICHDGHALSEGVAAWLRHSGTPAEILDGGFIAWVNAGLPAIIDAKIPQRDEEGRTVWVTRSRPKIDRIACPWLIRRFIDPQAAFLFVTPAEVLSVAERFAATSFDIDAEGVLWSHRRDLCTFDVMVEEFGLQTEPLLRLATIVRGADTARPELAPEAPGLLAASLGLSRMYSDDLEQLEHGMALYDAFYRWCRDATGETHNWPTNKA
jgi:rhodanese-related sulfurtransferase